MADLREQMAAGATQPAMEGGEKFKFTNPGETVCGEVIVAKFDIVTKFGESNLIEVSDDKRGQVTVWVSQAQLKAGLLDGRNQVGRRVQVGDKVFIRFDGTTDIGDGKTVKNFSLNVQAGDPTPVREATPAEPVSAGTVPLDSPF